MDLEKQIESAPRWHATNDQLGKLWGSLGTSYLDEADLKRAEDAYGHALRLLSSSADEQRNYAAVLDGLGELYQETGRAEESENCRRKALAIFEAMNDHMAVSVLHGHLANSLLEEHKYKEAESEASKAIEGMPGQDGAKEVVSLLLIESYARCFQRRCHDGLFNAQQAVDLARAHFRPDSLEAVTSWMTLGYMQWKTGDIASAGAKMREALRILREKNDLPYPVLVNVRIGALGEYQQYLNQTHRKAEARQVGNEIDQLRGKGTPVCNGCTVSVFGLSNALR